MRTRRSLFLAMLLVLFLPIAQSSLMKNQAPASGGYVAFADCSHTSAGSDCDQAPVPTNAPSGNTRSALDHRASDANTGDGLGFQLMAFAIALGIWLRLR